LLLLFQQRGSHHTVRPPVCSAARLSGRRPAGAGSPRRQRQRSAGAVAPAAATSRRHRWPSPVR